MPQRCLVIDDLAECIRMLPPFAQQAGATAAERVRGAVYSLAARHHWDILRHQAFATWLTTTMEAMATWWIVLDPFLEVDDRVPSTRLRVSRFRADSGVAGVTVELTRLPPGIATCGIIDDAASTGATLIATLRGLSDVGSAVRTVILAGSSEAAKSRVARAGFAPQWRIHIPGDNRVVHLRDTVALFPHSGTPSEPSSQLAPQARSLTLRRSLFDQPNSLWQVAALDSNVRKAVFESNLAIARALSGHLGRSATLADVGTLGAHVHAPEPRGEFRPDTPLEDVLREVPFSHASD